MVTLIVRPHLFVLAVLVACGLAAGLWWVAPGPSARAASAIPAGATSASLTAQRAAAESVLVVRRAGDHDALWLLSPLDGTPTAAGDLPGFAGEVAVSPDGASVAYLPESGGPRVWIGAGPLAPKTISLTPVGVKRAYSLTWIDDGRLLVSGVPRTNADYYTSRLFLVNAATGKVRSFRDLSGIEPSAATAVGKVAYVKLTTVVPQTGYRGPVIRESLKLLSLSHAGGGRTVWSEENRVDAAYRAFSRPQVSPDAAWFLTGQTGSDVRVTYSIRDRYGYPLLSVFTPALQAGAGWDAAGRRTAFAGIVGIDDQSPCVWIYDVTTGSLTRSAAGVIPDSLIDSLAWSSSGQLVANAFGRGARHNLVVSGDLTTATDLGTGRLPVWVVE